MHVAALYRKARGFRTRGQVGRHNRCTATEEGK